MIKPPEPFHGPWCLMCEGPGDAYFFKHLLELHGLNDQFDVRYPKANPGRGGIPKGLTTLWTTSESFRSEIQGILIIADNDEDLTGSLKELTDGLKREKTFGVPSKSQELAKKEKVPPIAILMIPIGEKGNIESLSLEGAYAKWGMQPAVDAYVSASPAKGWEIGRQSKARMTALIAVTCMTKPDANFATHWQEDVMYHVPVNSPRFNGIVEFLKDFPALIAA